MVFANVLEIWNVNRQWDFPIFNDAEEIESKQPFIFPVSILHTGPAEAKMHQSGKLIIIHYNYNCKAHYL